MTTAREPNSSSDSASLSQSIGFFAADGSVAHVMTSPHLDLFPSRPHDVDSSALDFDTTALFGGHNLLDSALGLQQSVLDPRRHMMMSSPVQSGDSTATTYGHGHGHGHSSHSPSRSQPGSQPRALPFEARQQDASPGPVQLQFIIGPECSRLNESSQHIPSAASLYQVVHPNVDDVIVNFDTKARLLR